MFNVVIGVDVSKDKFDICIKTRSFDDKIIKKDFGSFTNDLEGFDKLLRFISRQNIDSGASIFVMEATGVYHEDLAYYLHDHQMNICIELATKTKHYAKSLNIKTKTDKVDANILASIGLERPLRCWKPISPVCKELRDANRLCLSYKENLNKMKSQLHAMRYSHNFSQEVICLHLDQIKLCEHAIVRLEKQLIDIVKKDEQLYKRIKIVETVNGVGIMTVISIIAETNGFALFKNLRQVVSYSGMDIQHNQSGNHIGKTRISKKGNARIRQALYMPALSAMQHNKPIKALYQRVCEKNPNSKKKGVVAAMRKLLVLIYVLWSKNQEFDPNYVWGKDRHQ